MSISQSDENIVTDSIPPEKSQTPAALPILEQDNNNNDNLGESFPFSLDDNGNLNLSNKFVTINNVLCTLPTPFEPHEPSLNHVWIYKRNKKEYDLPMTNQNVILGNNGKITEAKKDQTVYFRSSLARTRRKVIIKEIQATTERNIGAIWKVKEIDGGTEWPEILSFNLSKLEYARMFM